MESKCWTDVGPIVFDGAERKEMEGALGRARKLTIFRLSDRLLDRKAASECEIGFAGREAIECGEKGRHLMGKVRDYGHMNRLLK